MINCIAVDDEPLALQLLADNISKVPFLTLQASCRDAFEATTALQENPVDLVFVDIQMPGLTGLQFIESLSLKPMVIIITAYKQYALDGYTLDVVDYLLKPVATERFMKACNKALDLYQLRNSGGRPDQAREYLFVNAGYTMVKVVFSDILYVEGLRDYVQIHLKSTPKAIVVRTGLKAMADELPVRQFIQVHKSFLVSLHHITAIKKGSVFIGEKELPVGDTFKDNVRDLLKGKI